MFSHTLKQRLSFIWIIYTLQYKKGFSCHSTEQGFPFMVPLNEVISCANHNKAATPCLIRVFIPFSSYAGFLMGE